MIPNSVALIRGGPNPENGKRLIDFILREETEELLNIALYEGANPVKGLEIMLKTHGTCNTVTALDQTIQQLSPEDRARAADLLVSVLYDDLKHTLQ